MHGAAYQCAGGYGGGGVKGRAGAGGRGTGGGSARGARPSGVKLLRPCWFRLSLAGCGSRRAICRIDRRHGEQQQAIPIRCIPAAFHAAKRVHSASQTAGPSPGDPNCVVATHQERCPPVAPLPRPLMPAPQSSWLHRQQQCRPMEAHVLTAAAAVSYGGCLTNGFWWWWWRPWRLPGDQAPHSRLPRLASATSSSPLPRSGVRGRGAGARRQHGRATAPPDPMAAAVGTPPRPQHADRDGFGSRIGPDRDSILALLPADVQAAA